MTRLPLCLFILLFFFQGYVKAQDISTSNRKAGRLFHDALESYRSGYPDKALADLSVAIREDPWFYEAWILTGDIRADKRLYADAIEAYRQALRIKPDASPNLYLITANLELASGLYADARNNFSRYLTWDKLPAEKRQRAERALDACRFALLKVENPVPFQPVNLGDSVNTPFDEYINSITSDGEILYFTRKQASDSMTLDRSSKFEEDFYFSRRAPGGWRSAMNLGPPINTHGNEGALSISPDGQRLFFAACHRDDGHGSCDIYMSRRLGNRWGAPVNLGTSVNTAAWESQPSFSSDGKTLYYASKRAGGKGSSDIWKTILQPDGSWSMPENLGDSVNTPAEEMSPFIHPDDQTLCFSSRGHRGMGGLDLFFVRKDSAGSWMSPVNLGYPINTHADEITLLINARGDLAYISSDMPGGKGKQDIYSFQLYPEARPIPTTYLKGIVFDAETDRRLGASFELTDLSTGKTVSESSSDPETGEFLLVLPTERTYGLNVNRDGYLFYSDYFELTGTNSIDKPFIKDIPLKPVRIGETVVLKNIFFDTDQYVLKPESLAELGKLLLLMRKNPGLKLEISGHTDNQGTEAHNLALSGNRARAVYEYLTEHGIPPERLSWKGYGLTRPVDTNDTPDGRANNRRTEFKVLDIAK